MTKEAPGFFDVDERLAELSAKGDDLERLNTLVDFELFRPALEAAVPRGDRSKGGRPPFDHVFMFKILILQAIHALSDERCEYLIKDRLSFMRFLGLGLADAVPDANTIWSFREALKKADAVDALFARFDMALREAGFLAMSGQIVDATIVAAPRQRNTLEEKKAIRDSRIPEGWADKPKKLAQKDRDARWTVKYSKASLASSPFSSARVFCSGGPDWIRLGAQNFVRATQIVSSGIIVFLADQGFELIANASARIR